DRHIELFGRPPQLAVADGGFASATNERVAHERGIRHVVLPRQPRATRSRIARLAAGERAVKDGSVRSSAVMVCGAADTAARAGCSVGWGSVSSRIICWCSAGPGPEPRRLAEINSIHSVERRGAKMRIRTLATHLI